MLTLQDSMGELYDLDLTYHVLNGTSNQDCAGYEYYSNLPRSATIQASINNTVNATQGDPATFSYMAVMALNLISHVYKDVELAVVNELWRIVELDQGEAVASYLYGQRLSDTPFYRFLHDEGVI